MCGICGFVNFENSNNQDQIKEITSKIIHRGPDQEGYFSNDKVSLGHRRLSIIDLSEKGRQPLCNEDKKIWITFNGEIYNYKELKQRLCQDHKFSSTSDTEVIVHLYEEYGTKCLDFLNGDFAFCIYDERKNQLFMAVDRFSVKHLYYYTDRGFIFSSELKSILAHEKTKKKINLAALEFYLVFGYISPDMSILEGAKRLPSGHYLIYDLEKRSLSVSSYYKLSEKIPAKFNSNKKSIKKKIISELNSSVKLRLVSDVPVGIFLSSGIDSSLIASLMKNNYKSTIHSFSVGFSSNNNDDESAGAKKFAKKLGFKHHEIIYSLTDLKNSLFEISNYLDEPFADNSVLPTYLLSKYVSKHVKVVLSGDGNDEIYGGYETFLADKYLPKNKFLSNSLINIFSKLNFSTNLFKSDVNPFFILQQLKKGLKFPPYIRHFMWKSNFIPPEINSLMINPKNDSINHMNNLISSNLKLYDSGKFIQNILYLDFMISLQNDMLIKADIASMYNSLEVRVPYLDHNFVEYSTAIDPRLKIKGTKRKYIFKKATEKILPKEIINRKKLGFGLPIKPLLHEIKDTAYNLFSQERVEKQGLFNYNEIKDVLDGFYHKNKDYRKKVWALMIFQLWYYSQFKKDESLMELLKNENPKKD